METKRLKLPIGIQTFEELRTVTVYISTGYFCYKGQVRYGDEYEVTCFGDGTISCVAAECWEYEFTMDVYGSC